MLLESLIERATHVNTNTVAVAAAEDAEVIEAVMEALNRNLANFILFGNKEKINAIIETNNYENKESKSLKIVHAESNEQAAELAVKAVSSKEANVLMKGNIPTNVILKAV